MLARFRSKKQSILGALSKPDDDYEDLSPKGNVDEEIRDLIHEINNLPGYVTTSSCGGRVAVYLEGEAKSKTSVAPTDEQAVPGGERTAAPSSGGGKGGGKWLFVSHKIVEIQQPSAPGAFLSKLGFSKSAEIAFPPADAEGIRFVHLKFEPMILHILAQSAEDAQTMLGAGMMAGFRESGISGIVDGKARPSMPMVAIRSSGMAMDCIIGFQSPEGKNLCPMVSEEYLRTIVGVTNARFRQNVQRKERFRQNILEQMVGSIPPGEDRKADFRRRRGGFQSASDRKAEKRVEDMRKREEALERRTQALHRGGALDGANDQSGSADDEDNLAFNVLLYDDGKNQTPTRNNDEND